MEADDYWSIDTILAEEQKVKVKLTQGIEGYGCLGEDSKESLDVGDQLELPLWLAKQLYDSQKLEIGLPKFFRKNFRDTLTADSTVLNLKTKSDYFYEIAFLLMGVLKDENIQDIIPVVHRTFIERYQMISDYSEGKSVSQNINSFVRKLTDLELKLFNSNKNRIAETRNFKQQHARVANYGARDNTMRKEGKRVRTNN
mmetsp:Transcript_23246/g.20613  ORF Transcript_23246/g.20613 Transcript_23246/m.20613 type:complete len:199 (+) Transcript_23246:12-608(+)